MEADGTATECLRGILAGTLLQEADHLGKARYAVPWMR